MSNPKPPIHNGDYVRLTNVRDGRSCIATVASKNATFAYLNAHKINPHLWVTAYPNKRFDWMYEPIPLTEAWLLANGFELSDRQLQTGRPSYEPKIKDRRWDFADIIFYQWIDGRMFVSLSDGDNSVNIPCPYISTLQQVLRLTGYEDKTPKFKFKE